MKTKYLLFAVAFILLGCAAVEQRVKIHIKVLTDTPVTLAFIGCDTREQVDHIVQTYETKGQEAGLRLINDLMSKENALGQKICLPAISEVVVVEIYSYHNISSVKDNPPVAPVLAVAGYTVSGDETIHYGLFLSDPLEAIRKQRERDKLKEYI